MFFHLTIFVYNLGSKTYSFFIYHTATERNIWLKKVVLEKLEKIDKFAPIALKQTIFIYFIPSSSFL